MSKAKALPLPASDPFLPALWALGAAAFWLIPDQKLLRYKFLAVQAVVILVAARLLWRRAASIEEARRSILDAPASALALSGALFWTLSPEPSASETEAMRLFFCGLAYWAASRSFAVVKLRPFLTAWCAGASAAALYAIVAAVGGDARPFASFGNPIFLGTALAATLPIALEGALCSEKRERAAWSAAAALQTAGLLLTNSRAAGFGLLTGLTLWALSRLDGRRRIAALGAAAVAAGLGAWFFNGREWTHSLIWRDAIALWLAKPWLGCGLGRFHLEFPAYASQALKTRWPEGRVIVNFAHNEYLQTLVETGPLGLAALAAAPAAAWLALRRAQSARAACAAGSLALFAAALVSPDLRFGASAFAAFVLLGIAVSPEPSDMVTPPALAACALAAFAWLAAKPALAVRHNAAEAPFHSSVDVDRIRELEDLLKRSPNDADAAEQLGYQKAKASDLIGAREAFRRAAELGPTRPGPLNNLGNLAYLAGDADGAIAWWEKSLLAAPAQIDSRLNLAKLLCERGRLKPCAAQLEEVLKRDPSNAKARVLYKKMIE